MENQKVNFIEAMGKRNPSEMFENLERYVDMVIRRIQPSVLLTGAPGMGKTYLVTKALKEKGFDNGNQYIIIKGRTTGPGLYRALYENKGKIIVFDDCDSVFKDADGVNLLKAALDSYDERHISFISSKPMKDGDGMYIPSTFKFTGSVIFISNLNQKQIDSAVRSRSFTVDIDLTPEQLLQRMEDKLEFVEPKVPLKDRRLALKALKEIHRKFEGVELNFRSLIKAIRIKQTGFVDWHMMVAEQCIDPKFRSQRNNKTGESSVPTKSFPTKAELVAAKAKLGTWSAVCKKLNVSSNKRLKIMNG